MILNAMLAAPQTESKKIPGWPCIVTRHGLISLLRRQQTHQTGDTDMRNYLINEYMANEKALKALYGMMDNMTKDGPYADDLRANALSLIATLLNSMETIYGSFDHNELAHVHYLRGRREAKFLGQRSA
jgi:mRNA-degrading endonuclease HigB of HigAB toxin-antitoxin module